MTENDAWTAQSNGGPVMVPVTRDGQVLPLEVVSRAMILLSERSTQTWGNAVRDALLGKS